MRALLAAFVNLAMTRFNLDVLLEPIAHGLWFKKRQLHVAKDTSWVLRLAKLEKSCKIANRQVETGTWKRKALPEMKFQQGYVGVRGFEPPTSSSRTTRANRAALHPERCAMSHPGDSNSRPTHYECVALPAELGWPGLRACLNSHHLAASGQFYPALR